MNPQFSVTVVELVKGKCFFTFTACISLIKYSSYFITYENIDKC